MTRLLGQFAALLLLVGILFSLRVVGVDGRLPQEALLISAWGTEHSLIAATMLVVGIFAVLSWDNTFPDLRDVMVLGPVPVQTHIIFLAKVSATAVALVLTVVMLNVLTALALSLALAPQSASVFDLVLSPARYRLFVAYWLTVLSAGAFIFCSLLVLQGCFAEILPRRWYLKVSAVLQMAAFCTFLSVYLLQPTWTTPAALSAPAHQELLAWLPSYWFLGLFQELNGSMHDVMVPLARRARYGLALSVIATAFVYALCYFRTFKRIVEEPDIVRSSRNLSWLPRGRDSLETAVLQFSIRSLFRSRRHRVLMAFYLGVGFAVMVLFLGLPRSRQQFSFDAIRQIFSSAVMMCAAVVGTRVVFAIPFDVRGNWIFRMTQVQDVSKYLKAIRTPLFVVAVLPVWLCSAGFFLQAWSLRPALSHLVVLGLFGSAMAWLSLHGFQKIPFTCSWLPGKSFFHMAFLAAMGFLLLLTKASVFEGRALGDARLFTQLIAVLALFVFGARWATVAAARSTDTIVQFEDVEPPAIQTLGLHRDGILPEG